jgi:serine/threonine protein kinase
VPSGSLLDRLRPPHPPLTALQRLHVLRGVAFGLQALHDADIVHLDVKPANILLALLDGGIVAKLTDFGISKSLDPTSTFAGSTMGGAGSLMWMAPELHRRPAAPSPAADVYAFGMVMYELYTGCQPWAAELQASRMQPVVVAGWVLEGRRPSIPGHVPQPLADIMRRCWDAEPSRRPALSVVVNALSHGVAHPVAGSTAAWGGLDSPLIYPSTTPSSSPAEAATISRISALSSLSIADVTLLVRSLTPPPPPPPHHPCPASPLSILLHPAPQSFSPLLTCPLQVERR